MGIYDFTVHAIDERPVSLAQFRGKVLLIVNTASHCGFTPQYAGLEALYERHRDRGLEILGFPSNQFGSQEPGTNEEIQAFCQVRFRVMFPLFAKGDVKGSSAQPLFAYLVQQQPGTGESPDIQWNFTKFLVDRHGSVVSRHEPKTTPEELEAQIEALLS